MDFRLPKAEEAELARPTLVLEPALRAQGCAASHQADKDVDGDEVVDDADEAGRNGVACIWVDWRSAEGGHVDC